MSLRTAASRLLPLCSPYTTTSPKPSTRSFITLPGSNLIQNLSATRTLPYSRDPLYALIADVDSYKSFVPYCSHSHVTHWSDPDLTGKRWPTRADLHVGWGGFNEKFTSRLNCVPGVSVEALSGGMGDGDASPVFKTLVTRWSLKPLNENPQSPTTEVHLAIQYHFSNPLYAAVSATVSDKIANLMIEAFEKQASQRLASKRL